MSANKSLKLFNHIAPFYALAYRWQRKHYHEIYANLPHCDLSRYSSILDLGCGNGAMASVFNELGLKTIGIDQSLGMLRVAKKQKENQAVTFVQVGNDNRLPFASKSFDIILAAYVAHGMQTEQRLKLYAEMKRLSRHLVILHEYNQNRSLLTNIVEYAEGGDYFNFIRIVEDELKGFFGNLQIVELGGRANCYICSVS